MTGIQAILGLLLTAIVAIAYLVFVDLDNGSTLRRTLLWIPVGIMFVVMLAMMAFLFNGAQVYS